jgi:hypothetical protein
VLRRNLSWLGIVVLVVAAVVTAGWGDAPARQSRQAPPTPARVPATGPTSLSVAEAYSLVRNVALQRRDLPGGFVPLRDRGGYRITVPSLHLCGGSFDSEHFRLAAHRVAFGSRAGLGTVRNVVVAYERGRAEQALAELRAAAPSCTRVVRPGPLEQPDTLVLRVRTTGGARHDLVVERRGDVLCLLRVDGRQGYLTLDLARLLGNRLESQLP